MTTVWPGDGERNCQEFSEKDKSDSSSWIFKCITIVKQCDADFKKILKGREINKKENLDTEFCFFCFLR